MNQEILLFWFLCLSPLLVFPKAQFLDFFHSMPELIVGVIQAHGFTYHLCTDYSHMYNSSLELFHELHALPGTIYVTSSVSYPVVVSNKAHPKLNFSVCSYQFCYLL